MSTLFWIILTVVLIAIFGGALLAGAAWLVWYAIIGIVIGGLGRLLVPGTGGMSILATVLAGVAGALIGGVVARAAELGNGLQFVIAVLAAAVLTAIAGAGSNDSERTRI